MRFATRSIRLTAVVAGLAGLFTVLAVRSMARNSQTSALFTPDSGKFQILVDGQQVGEEKFDLGPSGGGWVAHGSTEIKTPSGVERVSGTLDLRADGTPARYTWSTQGAKRASSNVTFNGPVATINLRVQGKQPYTQQFTFRSPHVAILDNNLYDQYAILARQYDWKTKGAQTFSVLIPQELTPGTVTVTSLGTQDVAGKKLDELQVQTEDLEVDLYLNDGRLVRIVSPSTNTEILRE